MKIAYLYLIWFVFLSSFSYAQQDKIDSLWQINRKAESPNLKVQSLLDISHQLLYEDIDSGRVVARIALEMARRHQFDNHEGHALILMGRSYAWNASFDTAAIYYQQSVEKYKSINDLDGLSNAFVNFGGIYYDQGDFIKTIEYWEQSLQIEEALKDTAGIAVNCNNIGEVYAYLNDYENAKKYFERCIQLDSLINDKKGLGYANLNMGRVAVWENNYPEAYSRFEKATTLFEELNILRPLAGSYANTASLLLKEGKNRDALAKYKVAKGIWESSKDLWGIAEIHTDIAETYLALEMLDSALWYGQRSIELSQKVNAGPLIIRSSRLLADVYDRKNQTTEAYKYLKIYTSYNDSIFNDDNKDEIVKLGLVYQFEKKSYLDSISSAQQRKLDQLSYESQIESKEQQAKLTVVSLIVLIVIVILIFRAYRIRTKSAKVIEDKKNEVEEKNLLLEQKNQDILAGIQYSSRIQQSILPEINSFKSAFADAFVLNLPKDIIGGDFYWAHQTESYFYFAVIDCTGHGVPGALVSMVAYNSLNYVVKDLGIYDTDEILNELSTIIEKEFTKDGKTAKDGMDMGLCRVHLENLELSYSGAMNNLLISRGDKMIELKADRQPVGFFEKRSPFKKQLESLQKKDRLFLFSDGYADQFGGMKGKKLKFARFKQLLLDKRSIELSVYERNLKEFFLDWRGEIEQVDDVCVLGVEI
jgi:serine phosphatase RsbU (regulator of sigma subunit)